MLKYIFYISISLISLINVVFAAAPTIECGNLPGCTTTGLDIQNTIIPNLISEVIKYIAVVAVIAIMLSGIMLLTSGGDDEKFKKAKHRITWSLVGVFLSISAWLIINLINNLKI